ncbi:hypothetical protein Poly30_24900 [Planctomycetes bacterium Poly30]|uniref:Uncharacterized protein n=1 Tax=Saltatorellus ferox TaxID=2528018 RepID=A0A518ESA0_9BACT|nr:hypothetical protein Poly30_24900 [Planctomycetes bacterium Poly30]
MEPKRKAHPCDGAWRPLDPFVRTGADPWSACPEGFTGFTVRWSTIAADPERWEPYADALEAAGGALRIDLDDVTSSGTFHAALEHQPELIKLYLPERPEPDALRFALAPLDEAAAENETALVLGVPRGGDPEGHGALMALAQESRSVVAFGLESFDEEQADTLGNVDGLALFSPGLEFAGAFRRGATAFEGTFGLLGPEACAEAMELAEASALEALQLERRIQRFVEGAFERATRHLSPDERAVALAGTFAFFEEEGGDPPVALAHDAWLDLCAEIDRQGLFPPQPE